MATSYIAGNNQGGNTQGRIPDLQNLAALVRERIWYGLLVMAVVFSVTYIRLKRIEPRYQSAATLLVEAQVPRLLNFQDAMAINIRNLEYFNTVINMLHNRAMMENAVQRSGLENHPAFFPSVTGLVQKAAAAQSCVSINPIEKSRLIKITVQHTDPEVAAMLANGVAEAYIQQDLDDRMSLSMRAIEWLQERADEYRGKMEEGLNQLQKYREDTKSVSLEDDQNIVIEKLKSINSALTLAQTELINAESELNVIQKQREDGQPWVQIAPQFSNQAVREALQAWQRQQQNVATLRERYKPDYPDLQEAIRLEQSLEAKFEQTCENALQGMKSRNAALQDRQAGLRKALEEQEQLAFTLDRQLVHYNELKRNVETDSEIYQSFLSRMKEASVADSLPTEMIRLAERARPAKQPFMPQPSRMLLRGALIGCALGFAVMVLLYSMDRRFRCSEDAEQALGLPVLVSLPLISQKKLHERGMITKLDPQGAISESFKTLRTILQVMPAYKNTRVVLVSSSQPGEGKSLVATNLAISFAQGGKKTLLLGADLRRPAFQEIFNLESMPKGLSEILQGNEPWQEMLQSVFADNLDVITSGAIPQNPSELLSDNRMASLIDEWRQAYDYLIIDSPPMMGVSDSMILMRYVDMVLFVVRQGITHSHGARHAVKRIQEGDVSRVGIVMNGVTMKQFGYDYGGYREYHNYQPPRLSSMEQ